MAVEDHPKFDEYNAARIARNEAKQHLDEMRGKPGEKAAQADLDKAQAVYDKIADEIDA